MPQHSEQTKNSTFQVFIGTHRVSFAKISGLGGGMPKEIYAEGGGVAAPHVMRTPKNSLRTVTLERGIQKNNAMIAKMKPGTFIPWIQILVLDNEKKTDQCLNINDGYAHENREVVINNISITFF